MGEYLAKYPWILGLLLGVLAFVLNTIRRLVAESRRMPRAKKLEYNMHRAARALRELGRARRVLRRSVVALNATRGQLISEARHRLRKAIADSASATNHLSAVLKKIPDLGCSINVMQNIDRYIQIAEDTRKECQLAMHGKTTLDVDVPSLTKERINSITRECAIMLDQARVAIDEWTMETQQATQVLGATTVDPIIFRSGGMLRNPFKPEDSMEIAQSESVILLHQTIDDIGRTNHCINATQMTINILQSSAQYDTVEVIGVVSNALDSIDSALGDAELPLPESLATGDTPFDVPGSREPTGALQQIYARLEMIEASLS